MGDSVSHCYSAESWHVRLWVELSACTRGGEKCCNLIAIGPERGIDRGTDKDREGEGVKSRAGESVGQIKGENRSRQRKKR